MSKIITVGLCPCWDVVCRVEGIDWGMHKVESGRSVRPAGKAMNISRALGWMGERNVAAGLWGEVDFARMGKAVGRLRGVRDKMTCVAGETRQNITVIDTVGGRDMHVRGRSGLASRASIRRLGVDLEGVGGRGDVFVFAGAMPEGGLLDDVIRVIGGCCARGGRISVDTSGQALKRIVGGGGVWVIKPNVAELCDLLGRDIKNRVADLVKAGRELLDRVEVVLISRGRGGAMVVTREKVICVRLAGKSTGEVLSTVGCGDYLLAGFLKGFKEKNDVGFALEAGVKAGTAKAWGWSESKDWAEVRMQVAVSSSVL